MCVYKQKIQVASVFKTRILWVQVYVELRCSDYNHITNVLFKSSLTVLIVSETSSSFGASTTTRVPCRCYTVKE